MLKETDSESPLKFWKEYCEENNLSYSVATGWVKPEKQNEDKEEKKD